MVFIMCKINYMLYKHILENYNSVPDFAKVSGIPQKEINAILLKESVVKNIVDGVKLCQSMNIDMQRLVMYGEFVKVDDRGKREVIIAEFRERYMRLSAVEKKQVDELIDTYYYEHTQKM